LITTWLEILPQQIGVAVHLSLPVPNNDKEAVQGLALSVSKEELMPGEDNNAGC
jgi:hypothetical protein